MLLEHIPPSDKMARPYNVQVKIETLGGNAFIVAVVFSGFTLKTLRDLAFAQLNSIDDSPHVQSRSSAEKEIGGKKVTVRSIL